MVGKPSQRSGSGQKTIPEVWEWSGGLLKGPGVVVSTSSEVRQWSVGPPGGPVVVGMPSGKSGSGREALTKF